MSTIKPEPGWIFVEREVPPERTEGGIIVPESVRSRSIGITPGESSSVIVRAVGATEDEHLVGRRVFLKATNENTVPVVNNEFGLVERQNGHQIPNFYLFPRNAVAGIQE